MTRQQEIAFPPSGGALRPETVKDAVGDLPVLRSREVQCPWCEASVGDRWSDSLERALQKEAAQRQRAYGRQVDDDGRIDPNYPVRLDESEHTAAAFEALRATVKAACPSCDRCFRVVRVDEFAEHLIHVIHGARSDKDEEYLRWKAQRDGGSP